MANRIIEIRVWQEDKKRMYYPDSYQYSISINNESGISYDWDDHIKDYLRNSSIFQQFTGLKDINGKEIYEGDIVLISKGKLGEQKCTIEWDNTGFVLLSVPEYNPSIPMELDWNFATEIEIVGNIYENSKLLESKSL